MHSKLFEKYLIISDLDGTFFGENQKILENNLEAIRYFQSNGGIFTLATGRDYKTLECIFPNAAEFAYGPAILCNGVYLYDFNTKKIKNELSLNKEEFLSFLKTFSEKFPDVGYRISTHFGYICPNITPFLKEKSKTYLSLIRNESLDSYLDIPWHKCVFVAPPETVGKMCEFSNQFDFKHLKILPSATTLMEVLPKSSGKESKLAELKSFYPDRIAICVGDYDNDLDMLKAADVAACPDNAINDVKEISTIHLCHHREGCIADLIYKLDTSSK